MPISASLRRLCLSGAASAALGLMMAAPVQAAPQDYRFEAVSAHVKAAADAVVTLRLIHVPDNKPVADAVIFASKMEMPMAGMAPMTTKVAPLKSQTPGDYPFQSDLSMGGSWNLVVSAKVQGESGVVTGTVPVMAMK